MKNKAYKFSGFFLAFALLLAGCSDYLDIVPEKTQELELIFNRKEQAYKALATCYTYLPKNDDLYTTYVLATDELTTPNAHATQAIELMRGMQSPNEPILSLWKGYSSQMSLFRGINDCNIFIQNIDQVTDMSQLEKDAWKGEALFLNAYYHFLLLNVYGPIPIMEQYVPISSEIEALRIPRSSVDECFAYISSTIDKAIAVLPERVYDNINAGRVDKVIAAAIKSRILLFAASPLFNGNTEFYGDFKGKDNRQLFGTSYDGEKWKKALDATREAIELAQGNGITLYEYRLPFPTYDQAESQLPEIQHLYNHRYMFSDKWNSETIWGHSAPVTAWYQLQAAALMKDPNASSNEAAWQWVAPTLRMAELYYTKNGLPIDQDHGFDYANRYKTVSVGTANQLEAQVGELTAQLHLNRESRFYANIGFDRGYHRVHDKKWALKMRKDETPGGRKGNTNDYLLTGYLLKKYNHPASAGATYNQLVTYPWPIIRLAELYLNLAEAANEYAGPSAEVFSALNLIRQRAGVPNVEQAWANPAVAKTPNKHQNKEGLREIIRQERLIELAFEGHRYNDIRRWKEADKYFNTPVRGWTVDQTDVNQFYVVKEVGIRSFITPRDYFQPIQITELTKNPNLVQNPGW